MGPEVDRLCKPGGEADGAADIPTIVHEETRVIIDCGGGSIVLFISYLPRVIVGVKSYGGIVAEPECYDKHGTGNCQKYQADINLYPYISWLASQISWFRKNKSI